MVPLEFESEGASSLAPWPVAVPIPLLISFQATSSVSAPIPLLLDFSETPETKLALWTTKKQKSLCRVCC